MPLYNFTVFTFTLSDIRLREINFKKRLKSNNWALRKLKFVLKLTSTHPPLYLDDSFINDAPLIHFVPFLYNSKPQLVGMHVGYTLGISCRTLNASVRVRKEDAYPHPDLDFWTYTHC